ncbi:hypothetical protein GCM10019016_022270 [Streptomyces prasinosporus]|uniref:Uncharacterized protein n=1 Tax=Streptomyces prasinosporus TaxID=68256 RepID=A0ABP6TIQ8_9ACTN
MPNPAQKCTTSTGIGADALADQVTRSSPPAASMGSSTSLRTRVYRSSSSGGGVSPRSRWPTCSRATSNASSMTARWSSGISESTARTAADSFSQILGTPKNCAGRTLRTTSPTFVGSAHR